MKLLHIPYLVYGGLGFWLPGVLLTAYLQDSVDLRIQAVVLPTTMFAVYLGVLRKTVEEKARCPLSCHFGIGIFVFGPVMMTLGASFKGGGFSMLVYWYDWVFVLLFSLLPPYTLIMSVYDGSAVAILVACLLLLVAHFGVESRLPSGVRSKDASRGDHSPGVLP